MNWLKKLAQMNWNVRLECLCADDFGASYKERNTWNEEDKEHFENYKNTRNNHQQLASLAASFGIECNIQDSDDKYSKHSDAYLYFPWSKLNQVLVILEQSKVPGDILDVPKDFPTNLQKEVQKLGWKVEYLR